MSFKIRQTVGLPTRIMWLMRPFHKGIYLDEKESEVYKYVALEGGGVRHAVAELRK